MLDFLRNDQTLRLFFTSQLTENGYGIVVDTSMPQDSYLAINVDEFYHKIGINPTPEVADIVVVAKHLTQSNSFHIYIIEMKNTNAPSRFTVQNIYNKFHTVVEDFMKDRYGSPFCDLSYHVIVFRLFFVNDAYKLKDRGLSPREIRSFLHEAKIGSLMSLPPFIFRDFKAIIEYEFPNPTVRWDN